MGSAITDVGPGENKHGETNERGWGRGVGGHTPKQNSTEGASPAN